jgi:hypothetical protein
MSDMFFFHDTLEPPRREDDRGLEDFHVVGSDGPIGTVADISTDEGEHYLVVHTGRWITSKNVVLPAGTVDRVDHDQRRIYVTASREEIKAAPEFDERRLGDRSYLEKIGWHYRRDDRAPARSEAADPKKSAAG